MKNMFRKSQKGFTLIELLIVIALLGALAVGLIGAIDPFEQLKKGTDTGVRDLVSQLQTAVIRYYAVKTGFPWTVANQPTTTIQANNATFKSESIQNMVDAGELRGDFVDVQGDDKLSKISLTLNATTNTLSVCYKPDSKSFQSDKSTKYNQDGTLGPTSGTGQCISTGGDTACWWCIQ